VEKLSDSAVRNLFYLAWAQQGYNMASHCSPDYDGSPDPPPNVHLDAMYSDEALYNLVGFAKKVIQTRIKARKGDPSVCVDNDDLYKFPAI
jgi:hypothetical protein